MKWISAMFFPKPESPVAPVTKTCRPITYTVGWEIHTKDGSRFSRRYEEVEEKNSKETLVSVNNEVSEMHVELERASKDGSTFVNLKGTVLRVADVTKVTVFHHESK